MLTVDKSVELAGGTTAIAKLMSVSVVIINNWRRDNKVPYARIKQFSKLTNHPIDLLAPDFFDGYLPSNQILNMTLADTLLLIGSQIIEKSNKERDDGNCINSYRGALFSLVGVSELLQTSDLCRSTLYLWADMTIQEGQLLTPIDCEMALDAGSIDCNIVNRTFKTE